MRASEWYLGLMAAAFGFAALVVGLEGAPWFGPTAFLLAAATALGLMVRRTVRTPKVVLVGDPGGGRLYRLHEALDEHGYGIRSCPGPGRRPCPVFEGGPCPIRGHPVAAVISPSASYRGPALPCGKALGVVSVTVLDALAWPPVVFGPDQALVSSAAGPETTVRAVSRLVEPVA